MKPNKNLRAVREEEKNTQEEAEKAEESKTLSELKRYCEAKIIRNIGQALAFESRKTKISPEESFENMKEILRKATTSVAPGSQMEFRGFVESIQKKELNELLRSMDMEKMLRMGFAKAVRIYVGKLFEGTEGAVSLGLGGIAKISGLTGTVVGGTAGIVTQGIRKTTSTFDDTSGKEEGKRRKVA